MKNNSTIIGKKIKRVDSFHKAKGTALFADDLHFDRMLYCCLVLAKTPHGILKELNYEKALSTEDVVDVITYKDIPGDNQIGEVFDDMPCVVPTGGKVRYYGDVVAIVVAKSPEAAEEGARNVKVYIEEIDPVLTLEQAIEDKIMIHENSNIAVNKRIRKGDINTGFDNSSHIFEDSFYASYQEHAYIETQGVVVVPDIDYGYTVYGTMQCPYYVQKHVSRVLNKPFNHIRVIQTETGGAFGGKEDVPSYVATYAAVASYKTNRPVKLIYSRETDIQTTSKRHPIKSHYKIGVDNNGKLKSMEIKAYMDMGAYATLSPIVMFRSLVHAAGSYEIPNVSVDIYGVYTNKIPCGAFRGFGSPQVLFAVESMIDEISKKMKLDPIDFRLNNALRKGSRTSTNQLLEESVGAEKTLNNVSKISNWEHLKVEVKKFNEKYHDKKRGLGVSHIIYGVSLGAGGQHLDASGGHVQINNDGTVDVRIGGTEMGQGAKTVIALIASEELGVDTDFINVHQPDTAFVPDSGPTVASRTTIYSGNAVRKACIDLRTRLIELFSEMFGSKISDVRYSKNHYYDNDGNNLPFAELAAEASKRNVKLVETGWYKTPSLKWNDKTGQGEAYVVYSYASQIVLVEVDMITGLARVIKAFTSHDVGKALNPEGVVGQIQGGFVQGMGYALYEDLKIKKGKIITDNFNTYIIPTIRDIPDILEVDIVEDPYSQGPYGAKGIGEPSLMPTPAAIANGISRAIGKRVKRIPATSEYILKLIKEDSK
ncbi:MAG: xanthine dehydrogenase family protein [Kosmotoga sp.]|nr:MAG: xanthine dehydrogenase family protein [Kosmotoga sp.]